MTRRRSLIRLLTLSLLAVLLLAACVAPVAPAGESAPAAESGEAAADTAAADAPKLSMAIMAPANPGGGWDQTARLMAQIMQDDGLTDGAVEVTNVPGAGGTVGLAEMVTQHAGDASLMMMMGKVMVGAILTNQSPVTLDQVTPLARLTAEYEAIVVPADSPIQTMADLVAAFQADPQSVTWAGGSAGGTDHILVGQIANAVGVAPEGINYIAYAGGGEASAAILGGQVTAGVSGIGEFVDFVSSGQMRMLAVSSDKRLDIVADVPTLQEEGVDVVLLNWRGVVAGPDLSAEDQAAVIDLLTQLNESAAWQEALATNGWDNVFLAGDDFGQFIAEENATITDVLKSIGLVE
jgi:putative tricarboxylic transport membrane protein